MRLICKITTTSFKIQIHCLRYICRVSYSSPVNMATAVKPCMAQLSRSPITLALRSRIPTPLTLPAHQIRNYAAAAPVKVKTFASSNPQKNKKKGESGKKKKKGRTVFKQYDMKLADQYSLCDAMRYVNCYVWFIFMLTLDC